MFCSNCGNQLADGSKFCPFCGAQLAQPQQQAAPAQRSYPQEPSYPQEQSQPQYGYSQPQDPYAYSPVTYQTPVKADPMNDPRGMKWFKFIIYFQLFASAVISVITAITMFTGAHYQGQADMVYRYFPGLKGLDVFYGIALIALAAFAIVTRQNLAKFRKNGPRFYFILIIASLALALIYSIAGSSILNVSLGEVMDGSSVGSLIGNIALLIINIIYFKKREDLFVN